MRTRMGDGLHQEQRLLLGLLCQQPLCQPPHLARHGELVGAAARCCLILPDVASALRRCARLILQRHFERRASEAALVVAAAGLGLAFPAPAGPMQAEACWA